MELAIPETKRIYRALSDECSREIFSDRVLFALTDDYRYVRRMLERFSYVQDFWKRYEALRQGSGRLFLYGAGIDAERFLRFYPDCSFEAFCDRDLHKQEHGFYGHKVIAPEDLIHWFRKDVSIRIIITTARFNREIAAFLQENGIPQTSILNFGAMVASLIRRQYFEPDIFPVMGHEIFVDGGCFDGETSASFLEAYQGQYERILAFEPGRENFRACEERFKDIQQGKVYYGGLWKENGAMSFSGQSQSGHFSETSKGDAVPVYALDELDEAKNASFIKMDIEGAELAALQGAEGIIRRNHPKLAICVYHKPEDIFEIPSLLLDYVPSYSLWLRHYSFVQEETVLYAVER